MKVYLEVTHWLSKYLDGKSTLEMDVVQGETIKNVISRTAIPNSEIGFMVIQNDKTSGNGKMIDENYPVFDGMQVKVYHLIVGG